MQLTVSLMNKWAYTFGIVHLIILPQKKAFPNPLKQTSSHLNFPRELD